MKNTTMPVLLNSNPASEQRQKGANGLRVKPTAEWLERESRSLSIGLINNMPDAALEATERQFLALLNAASEDFSVRLLLYWLPGVPRNEQGARHISSCYSSVESLWDRHLDGLIVTGREPLTVNLADEPYWESFTRIVEWAQNNTYSAAWSCLAAHAAVLAMDGVRRVKNGHKHCGIFDCTQISDHFLTASAPARFKLPHSRWNGVREDELTERGYRILTWAGGAGADTFVKQYKSLFVFFQGHPEYEQNTLLLEYRRDVGRYMRGEAEVYPLLPRGYFDRDTAIALAELQRKHGAARSTGALAEVHGVLEKASVKNTWRPAAKSIYRNWLEYICAQKKQDLWDRWGAEASRGERFAPLPVKPAELPHPGTQSTSPDREQPRPIRAAR